MACSDETFLQDQSCRVNHLCYYNYMLGVVTFSAFTITTRNSTLFADVVAASNVNLLSQS